MAVKAALDAWFHEADRGDWRTPAEVKKNYAAASIVTESGWCSIQHQSQCLPHGNCD
ncbi:MAG: hypothetical protein DMG57_06085 [Acidobacteria bacterium]|nr:MAG: hypothetical protein DMG57_06085 [Acidobacteriota bacterium]